ncbi:MAG: hypothetical protein MIO90_05035, partial [Methanomassiliicoccales archaeon]|nr:hypothetical protein [Methanomassiliicoccales archaeon]
MDYNDALVVIPNLVGFALIAWMALKVYIGKETEHRRAMYICFAFIAINSLVLLMEKLFSDADLVLSVVLIEYICESVILISLLVFVMQYVGVGRMVTPRNVLLLGSPGLLVIVLNATNQWHHLFYLTTVVLEKDGFFVFEAEYGPLFLIWMVYFLGVILATTILMARALVETPRGSRGGVMSLLFAMVVIMVTGVLYVFSARDDPTLDVLSIGLTLTVLIIFFGERHSNFTNLHIIRFREAIGGMGDGVIILDPSLKVVYANKVGQSMLDENEVFIRERLAARGVKIPVGSNRSEERR